MGRSIDLSRYLWPDTSEGRQPQYPARLDRESPLGAKVVYASTLAGVAVDVATGKTGINTAAVPKATPRGLSLNFNGSSAYITLPTTNLAAAYPITVACWFEKTTSVSQVIYSLNGAGYSAIAGYTPANLNLSINLGSNPGALGYPFASIPSGWNHLVVVHYSGSFTMYLNGVNVTASTTYSENWGQPAAGNHSIGQRLNGASSRFFNGGIQDFIVFNGELSAAEAQQVYLDSYQIFSTPEPILLGVAAAGIPLVQVGETDTAQVIAVNPQRRLLGQALESDTAQSITNVATGHIVPIGQVAETDTAQAITVNPQHRLLGQAIETDTAQGVTSVTVISPSDRGTLDLLNCSVTPNGATPQINIKNRYIGDANTTGARFTFGKLTGVNGMTPVLKVDRSNMEINASAHFLWSTTGLKGSWTPFANFTSDASFFTVSHSAAFTSDTIYFASNNPWPVSYTLPWIQSLEASGFVSHAPSGGTSYQFETRSATTDGATAGVGNVIAAQPLYSFKISNATASAPDGNPKRAIVLMAGTHAAEDVGNYALEGAVAFLVSADAQAAVVRDWFNIYVYPMTATAGRAGGGQRNDFENTLKTTDVNREWPNANLETVVKHKAAIQADAGSSLAFLLDFHGTHLSNEGAYNYYNGPRQAKWTTAIRTYLAGLEIRLNGTAGLASKWAVDSKSSHFGISPEYPYHNDEVMPSLLGYGEKHLRAVAYLATAGEFALIGQALESDTAQAISFTGNKIISLGQATEVGFAQAIVPAKPLGLLQVTETDTAQALTKRKAATLAQASETGTAQALTKRKAATLAQASETGTAQALTKRKAATLAQASETGTAQALTKRKAATLAQASETGTAQAIGFTGNKIISLGQATEASFAQAIAHAKSLGLLQASETGTAQALTKRKAATLAQASETDTAQAVSPAGVAWAVIRNSIARDAVFSRVINKNTEF